jgi:hypothetical protein
MLRHARAGREHERENVRAAAAVLAERLPDRRGELVVAEHGRELGEPALLAERAAAACA